MHCILTLFIPDQPANAKLSFELLYPKTLNVDSKQSVCACGFRINGCLSGHGISGGTKTLNVASPSSMFFLFGRGFNAGSR